MMGWKSPCGRCATPSGCSPPTSDANSANSPFDGVAAPAMRLLGRGPSRISTAFCNQCQVAANKNLGGVETELTLLFGDVRGSTSLAEKMSPSEFSTLISRFFIGLWGLASSIRSRHPIHTATF